MIPSHRRAFNAGWRPERHQAMLDALGRRAGGQLPFPLSETPCFFPRSLMNELEAAGLALIEQLAGNAEARAAAEAVVPERFRGPGAGAHPAFLQVDFGLVRDAEGRVHPMLVELQAFASLYGFQHAVAEAYRDAFALSPSLDFFLGGVDAAGYDALVRETIVGPHDPERVVLMEIEPRAQKTWPDFFVTESRWGVRAVDTADIRKDGRRLTYERDGRRVPIARVYNRVIPDELERKGIALPFDYRDDLDVEWAGHPSWYFQISKFSIPWLTHQSVPRTWRLDAIGRVPGDPEGFLLKPLFSFAGGGIRFAPTDDDLKAVPAAERANYILQERVRFAPVIETPDGPTQAEIRMMYLWTDAAPAAPARAARVMGGWLTPVLPLIRMGRGKMMGVDHNKGLRWVGASAALIE